MTPSKETSHLLHRLWTKAVGTPGYVKKDWLALEAALLELERAVGQPEVVAETPSDRPTAWNRVLKVPIVDGR